MSTPPRIPRTRVRITPAADDAVRRHRRRIGGSYSAAACSLLIGRDDRLVERVRQVEILLLDLSRHVDRAISLSPGMTPQAHSLKSAARAAEELQRMIAVLS